MCVHTVYLYVLYIQWNLEFRTLYMYICMCINMCVKSYRQVSSSWCEDSADSTGAGGEVSYTLQCWFFRVQQ